MVETLEARTAIIGKIDIKDSKLYEIDLGYKGFLTAREIVELAPECESDGCCYSGGGCYSNCDM